MRFVFIISVTTVVAIALATGCYRSKKTSEEKDGGTDEVRITDGDSGVYDDEEGTIPTSGALGYAGPGGLDRAGDSDDSGGFSGVGGTGGPIGNRFPCTEQGIRDAIEAGGGPYTFNCEFRQRVVTQAEIVIDNDVILDGEGNLTLEGIKRGSIFTVARGVEAELRGFMVTRAVGTAIVNYGTLAISVSTVSASSGHSMGGGIRNVEGATMTITESILSGNSATDGGGGVSNDQRATMTITNTTVTGNSASEGAGVHNWGTLTMKGVVVSGNSASPGDSEGAGGGIANWGTLVLTNSTVSGNDATAGGGGIYNFSDGGGGTLTMINSAVSRNSSINGAGGIFSSGGLVTLTNSIVDDDCDGDINSNGYNIESPGDSCWFDQSTDQVNLSAEDLALGPLEDNGGPTDTHSLDADSIAIDRVPAAYCLDASGLPLTIDQRGASRPSGSMCDVGAFEVQQ